MDQRGNGHRPIRSQAGLFLDPGQTHVHPRASGMTLRLDDDSRFESGSWIVPSKAVAAHRTLGVANLEEAATSTRARARAHMPASQSSASPRVRIDVRAPATECEIRLLRYAAPRGLSTLGRLRALATSAQRTVVVEGPVSIRRPPQARANSWSDILRREKYSGY